MFLPYYPYQHFTLLYIKIIVYLFSNFISKNNFIYHIQTKAILSNLLLKYHFQTQLNSFNFKFTKIIFLTLIFSKVILPKFKPNGP